MLAGGSSPAGVSIGIMPNLRVELGRAAMVTILSLLIHEHGIALHLLNSSLISLIRGLQFSLYTFGMSSFDSYLSI